MQVSPMKVKVWGLLFIKFIERNNGEILVKNSVGIKEPFWI